MSEQTLFPDSDVQMDSPELAWYKKYGITVDIMEGDTGWMAVGQKLGRVALGDSRDQALVNLAKVNRIRFWNEEELYG